MDNSYVIPDLDIKKYYNTDYKTIDYNNNREYRECLRRVFYMTCNLDNLIQENPDYDDETLDEELYENENTITAIDNIFERTKDNCVFQKMYLHAAGKLISERMDLGMVVLFSYDFFENFHSCLVKFLNDGILHENDENVQNILMN